MNSRELLEALLGLSVEERRRIALEAWRSTHGTLDDSAAEALAEAVRQADTELPDEERLPEAVHGRVFGQGVVDLDQRALDEKCVRYRHVEREIDHCANPRCPSKDPEGWAAFRDLQALERPEG